MEHKRELLMVEKKNMGALKKKPSWGGYRGNKPRGKGGIDIKQKKYNGALLELKGSYFETGPDQADMYKKRMKKLEIVIGMKYSAEMSYEVKMMTEKPLMIKILTKLSLAALKVDEIVAAIVTAVLDKYNDLHKEQMKTYTKKLKEFEKDIIVVYLVVIWQCTDEMIYDFGMQYIVESGATEVQCHEVTSTN